MKLHRAHAAWLLLSLFAVAPGLRAEAPAAAVPRITADYVDPENFSDFRDAIFDTEKGRQHIMEQLNEHLAQLGERLPAGQRLEIRFTDINLAGEFEPWRGIYFNQIRIMKDIYSPRMEFSYRVLDAQGAVLREGTEKLSNLAYLLNVSPIGSHDGLRHDKQLLTDWVRREFRRQK